MSVLSRFRSRSHRPPSAPVEARKLHVGAGTVTLPGWTNVDNQAYPGIDHVLDVTQSFPFVGAEFIFAEHFIEHLAYEDGLAFLRRCRAALRHDGVLRLSTPNLDWVWSTHYHFGAGDALPASQPLIDCFNLNKAFRGWGHQFLYNRQALEATLRDAGFATVEGCSYGESRHPELRHLEHHETYRDTPELSHLLVVEASGHAAAVPEGLAQARSEFLDAIRLR
jgi:predicted SAM-dependent methyltransferase